jgi:plastocyanin
MPLRLNIDTNQFCRTFEDRSYVFQVAKAPLRAVTSTIYNLAVRGRRGNIAQVRNSMEYDFTPQRLKLSVGDYIHPQWTGSNHNPAGNAGNGRNRWDRSNIVQMINNDASANYPEPLESQTLFDRTDTAYLAAFIGQAPAGGCLSEQDAANDDQSTQNCAQLNGNPTGYFDLGLIKMNTSGIFNYMCTRNNDFTNRSHKGTLVVTAFGRRAFLIILLTVVSPVLVPPLVVSTSSPAAPARASPPSTGTPSGLAARCGPGAPRAPTPGAPPTALTALRGAPSVDP